MTKEVAADSSNESGLPLVAPDTSEIDKARFTKGYKRIPDDFDISLVPEECPDYLKRGCALSIYDMVDGTWRKGRVLQVNILKRHVLVHFTGYNKRYDEWLPYNSARLRPGHSIEQIARSEADVSLASRGIEGKHCDRGTANDADNDGGEDNRDKVQAEPFADGGGGTSLTASHSEASPLLSSSPVKMPVAVAPSPSQRPRRGGEGERAKNSLFTPDSNYRKARLKHINTGDISSGESTPPDVPSRPAKPVTAIPKAPIWQNLRGTPVSDASEAFFALAGGAGDGCDTVLVRAESAGIDNLVEQVAEQRVASNQPDGQLTNGTLISVVNTNGHVSPSDRSHQPAAIEEAARLQPGIEQKSAPAITQCKKESRERRKSTPPSVVVDITEGRPKRCGLGELARTSLFINHPVLPEIDGSPHGNARSKRTGEGEAAKNELFIKSPRSTAQDPIKSPAASHEITASRSKSQDIPKSPSGRDNTNGGDMKIEATDQHSLEESIKKEHVPRRKVVAVLPSRSLPKRGELGEGAKNALFTNPPPRYEPAITLDTIKSGAIDVDAVLNDKPAFCATAQPKLQEPPSEEACARTNTEDSTAPLSVLEKGQGVYARWDEDKVYYPARVDHVHSDGSYTVVFDDGIERTLSRGLIISPSTPVQDVVPKHYQRPKKPPCVKTDKPVVAAPLPEQVADESDEDSIIECVCGTNADCGRMIQCDHCETWHHNECVGIGQQDHVPAKFSCHGCKRVVYARTPKEVFASVRYPSLLRQRPSGEHAEAIRKSEKARGAHLRINDQLFSLRRAMAASALRIAEFVAMANKQDTEAVRFDVKSTEPQSSIAGTQPGMDQSTQDKCQEREAGSEPVYKRQRRLLEELECEYSEIEKRVRLLETQMGCISSIDTTKQSTP